MTRAVLSLLLCGLCLAAGLYASNIQSENFALANELDHKKRTCDLLEASCERVQYEINARLHALEHESANELASEPGVEFE